MISAIVLLPRDHGFASKQSFLMFDIFERVIVSIIP